MATSPTRRKARTSEVTSFSVDGDTQWAPKVTQRLDVETHEVEDAELNAMNHQMADSYDQFLEEAGRNTKALTGKSRL